MTWNNDAEHTNNAAARMKIVFLKFIVPSLLIFYLLTLNNTTEHTNNAAVRMKIVFLTFIVPPYLHSIF